MQSDLAHPFSATQSANTPELHLSDPGKKRKKKRSRDAPNIETPNSDASKDRQKKRKRLERQSPEINTSVIVPSDQHPPSAVDLSKHKKKKKKKDKGKAKDTAEEPTTLPDFQMSPDDLDANAQASAAALLSAIVAAATGASPEMLSLPSTGSIDLQYPPPILPSGHPPFMAIAPPYPLPPQHIPDPSSFSNMGLPFPDLSFGSNEDVLRTLQDLDIAKIANVLKTLGEAAAAANVPSLPPYPPPPMFYPMATPPQQLTPVSQNPAPSNAILGIPPKKSTTARPAEMTPAVPEQPGNPEHAELLATRWLGASKLAELVQTEGLVYKKGKFSAIEEQSLHEAIDEYRINNGFSTEELQDIIFPKPEHRERSMGFWRSITAAVPLRPIIAVYHHVRRTYHPLKQQGKWSADEDNRLKQAVADLGQQWEKVSVRVGRMSSDCRDRYRNHIQNRELRVTGPWTKEEEEQLTRIVTDMTIKQGKDIDNDVFWGKVSELMGGRRGRQQCRIKWTDALSKTVKNEGLKPRWSQQDAFILVHKVDSLGVRDDTEIDWKTLSDPDWNLWSAHSLQRRWLTMKRSIKGYENMSHAEIMDILRLKKAHFPPPPSQSVKKRKERKVTSAAAIPDGDAMSSADTTKTGSESTTVDSASCHLSEDSSESDSSSNSTEDSDSA